MPRWTVSSSLPAALEQGRQVITNIEMVANLFPDEDRFRPILLGVVLACWLVFPSCRASTRPLTS